MGRPKVFPSFSLVISLLAVAAVFWPLQASAQRMTRCDKAQRVHSVKVSGSPRFDAITLAASIVTHEPGVKTRWFRIGPTPCLDSLELRRDALRLAVMHRQVGWFQASVIPTIDRRPDGVRLRFAITPGHEAILDTIQIYGLPEPAAGTRGFDAPLRALEHKRFDRTRVDSTIDLVVARLRDAGYARAPRPQSQVVIDSAAARVTLTLRFATGPRNVNATVTLANYAALGTVGGIAVISGAGTPIAVVRASATQYRAFSLICPHAGTTVAISGAGFRCPNHGATFNGSGAWTGGERTTGLFEFTVASTTTAGTITISS